MYLAWPLMWSVGMYNHTRDTKYFRKCGVVVCSGCSARRFLLPAQSSKPLRVCNSCFDELSKSSTNQDFSSKGNFTYGLLAYFHRSVCHLIRLQYKKFIFRLQCIHIVSLNIRRDKFDRLTISVLLK